MQEFHNAPRGFIWEAKIANLARFLHVGKHANYILDPVDLVTKMFVPKTAKQTNWTIWPM